MFGIYKIKHVVDESINKYKEIFMAHGLSQKEGIDYETTFAPITRYTSIISILAFAAVMKWKIHQMDVKSAFLEWCSRRRSVCRTTTWV